MAIQFQQLNPVKDVGSNGAALQALQNVIITNQAKKNALLALLGEIGSPLVNQSFTAGREGLQRRSERKTAEVESKAKQDVGDLTSQLLLSLGQGGEEATPTEGQVPTQEPLPMRSLPLGETTNDRFSGGISNKKTKEELFSEIAKTGRLTQEQLLKLASEMKLTQAGRAGELDITGKQLGNQGQILGNQGKVLSNQGQILGNQGKVLSNSKKSDEQAARRELVPNKEGDLRPRFLVEAGIDTKTKEAKYNQINAKIEALRSEGSGIRSEGSGNSVANKKVISQVAGVEAATGLYLKTLEDINKFAPNIFQRAMGATLNLVKIPTRAGVKIKSLNGLSKRLRIEIARLGDVGNLTKDEQESAERLIPDPLDTIAQQQQDANLLLSYLSEKKKIFLGDIGLQGATPSQESPVSSPSQESPVSSPSQESPVSSPSTLSAPGGALSEVVLAERERRRAERERKKKGVS